VKFGRRSCTFGRVKFIGCCGDVVEVLNYCFSSGEVTLEVVRSNRVKGNFVRMSVKDIKS